MNEIEIFLRALFGAKPEDLYILLWTKEGKLSAWFKDCAAAAAYAKKHNSNIYAGVGLSPAAYGPKLRCKAADIAAMVALPADIDLLGDAHKSKALPGSEDHARKIIPPQFPASMVIHSGHGLQAWWILDKPWIFASDDDRRKAQELAVHWDRYLKHRASRLGFTTDSVFDLSRIMRVPGTINAKDGCEPVPARIQSCTEIRYTIPQILAFLDQVMPVAPALAAAPEPTAPVLVKPGKMPRAVDAIVYNPNATINPGIFAALWSNDMKFRLTWAGGRRDFQGDQSQSAYDLALANILYDAGVPDQLTADALVHHRRLRQQPAKANFQNYLTRTLERARSRKGPLPEMKELAASIEAMLSGDLPADDNGLPSATAIERLAVPVIATVSATEPPTTPIDPVSDNVRGDALKAFNTAIALQINGAPVTVTKAVRIPLGDSVTWRLHLSNGAMIHMEHQGQWSKYDEFAGVIRSQVNGIIAIPNKKADWERCVLPDFQLSLVEEAVREDADFRGVARDLIDDYLADRGVWTREYAYSEARLNGLPFPYAKEGDAPRICVYVADIVAWLARTRSEKRTAREITPGLSAIGCHSVGIRRNRRTTQNRWLLGPEWKAEDYIKEQKANLRGSDEREGIDQWQN
jgi:hypothetical protein